MRPPFSLDVEKDRLFSYPEFLSFDWEQKFLFYSEECNFLIHTSFTMSINKSQGQTLSVVELYLEESCFSYKQLNVSCSRVENKINLFAFVPLEKTTDIIYQEVDNIMMHSSIHCSLQNFEDEYHFSTIPTNSMTAPTKQFPPRTSVLKLVSPITPTNHMVNHYTLLFQVTIYSHLTA